MATIATLQQSAAQGTMPKDAVLHRATTMFGGLLLMVPGLIAKVVGTMLILPGTRHFLIWWFRIYITAKLASGAFKVFSSMQFPNGGFRTGTSYTETPSGSEFRTQGEREVFEVKPKSIEHRDVD